MNESFLNYYALLKLRFFPFLIAITIISGCTSIAKIENEPVSSLPKDNLRYSIENFDKHRPVGDTLLFLTFSGGGTRAAALSYGVLEELKNTTVQSNGKSIRLLDEIDRISSVSGGSFTSAYYGLFGDQIFDDFKEVFLYEDVQGELSDLVLNVFNFLKRRFTNTSRTEAAIDYYDKYIFRGKTFSDIQRSGGPMILINASDINARSQFVFVQGQLDFLCTNLSDFKVARAVAASSAVPILFDPIVIKRHDDCHLEKPLWLTQAEKKATQDDDQRLKEVVNSFNYYLNKDNPPYITLLDGGITDNLGIRTILRSISVSGGAKKVYEQRIKKHLRKPPKQVAVIVVNASTTTETGIGKTTELPSIADTLSSVTDIQLHLYNNETNSLLKEKLNQWINTLSTKENPIKPYYIELDVSEIDDHEERLFFNKIPTSFSLKKEEADKLIEIAKKLLRDNKVYQTLLNDMNNN